MSDIDVVEKVLADQPDLPVHVPYAGNTSPGIASFNSRDFIVEENGAVQLSKEVQGLTEEIVQAVENAKQSEQNAAESEANAKQSEINAKQSETNAKQSETNAAGSETNAANSAQSAQKSASAAATSAEQAAESEETTNTLVERASAYAEQAEAQANAASESAASALRSKETAQQAATKATTEADRAESAADKAEQVVAGIGNVYKPQGSLAFASLPAQPAEQYQGFVWNITDTFVTDNRFLEGAGQDVAAGANVACVYDNGQYKYDLLGNFIDISKFSAVIDLGTFNKINDNTYTKALSTEIQNALKENNIAMMVSVVKESNTYKFTFCDYTRMVNEALLLEATILNVDDRGLFTQLELSVAESVATFKISEVNLSNYYIKPSTGIPKTDLASAVQASLGKADTALQSVPIATSSKVGGVKPTSKTTQMTQAVGVDSNGALWTVPAASGGIEQNEVIAVKSLPAATADSPDFVQTLDGKLYRKKSSQTNGIDTTKLQGIWKLKTTSNVSGLTNFNTDMTASASAVAHAFDEDLFGFIFSGQTFNTFNYYIEGFTLYESGTWQIKDDIEFYAAADNLSYKTELLAMMNQCYTKQTSSIITTYSYEEVGGTEVVANPTATGTQDLTSLQVGGTVYNIPQGSGGITNAEVIEYADVLPTASETSPNFVQTPDGTLYRKKAVEGGSLSGRNTFNVSFTSNGSPYTEMSYITGVANDLSYGGEIVYSETKGMGGWNNTAYKTIQIANISALTNVDEFTQWLTANATGGGASVSYEYVAVSKVLYDYSSSDPNINWGKTGGILSGQTVTNSSLAQYSVYRVYIRLSSYTAVCLATANNMNFVTTFTGVSEGNDGIYVMRFKITSNEVSVEATGYFTIPSFTWNNRPGDGIYCIYKIEGVS